MVPLYFLTLQCLCQWVQLLDSQSTALQPREVIEASSSVLQMPAHIEFIARGSREITEQERYRVS